MLLPAPWMCFRTWRPHRGPVRTLLKDERTGQYLWLLGGRAALWEALEQGTTHARLHDRAGPLGLEAAWGDLIHQWMQAGLLQDLAHSRRQRGAKEQPVAPQEILVTSERIDLDQRSTSIGEGASSEPNAEPIAEPISEPVGELTTESAARAWLATHGYPFEAHWPAEQRSSCARQVMDRLDFLRESGVFQIRIVNAPAPPTHDIERIRLAARAQGFSVVDA